MKCPCGADTRVVDVREANTPPDFYTRRRRECLSCQRRFSTLEVILDGTIKHKQTDMKPKDKDRKPKPLRPKNNSEQVKQNAQARRRLEEIRDEECDEEINDILRGMQR